MSTFEDELAQGAQPVDAPIAPAPVANAPIAPQQAIPTTEEELVQTLPNQPSGFDAFMSAHASQNWAAQYAFKVISNATSDTDFVVSPALRSMDTFLSPKNKDYKPPIEQLAGTKYEQFADAFVNTNSQTEFESTKQWIDMQELWQKNMASHPVLATAGMVAEGFTDPINLIGLAAMPARIAGASRAAATAYNAGAGAVTFGATSYAQGKLVQDNNPYVSDEDVMFQAFAGAAVGSLVGGAVGYFTNKQIEKMTGEAYNLYKYGTPIDPKDAMAAERSFKKAIAMVDEATEVSTDVKAIPGELTFRPLTEQSRKLLEISRGGVRALSGEGYNALASNIPTVNKAGQFFFDSEIKLEGNPYGLVGSRYYIDRTRAEVSSMVKDSHNLYKQYVKANKGSSMKIEDFQKQVTMTAAKLRRDPTYTSGIKEVDAQVRLHDKYAKQDLAALKKAGILADDKDNPLVANYHQTRVWSHRAAVAVPDSRVKQVAMEQYNRNPGEWSSPQEVLEVLQSRLVSLRNGQDPSDINRISEMLDGELKGSGGNVRDSFVRAKDGFIYSKEWRLDDDLLAEHGLIETNSSQVQAATRMQVARLLQKRRFLDLNGVKTVDDLVKKAQQEFEEIRKGIDISRPTQAEKIKANLGFGEIGVADIETLKRLIKANDGTIMKPTALTPYLQSLRTYTTTNMLGNVVPHSLPTDIAFGYVKMGFSTIFKKEVVPLVSQLAKLDFSTYKGGFEDAKSMGLIVDLVNSDMIGYTSGGDYGLSEAGLVGRINSKIMDVYGKLSGMDYWNNSANTVHSIAVSSKAVEFMEQFTKGTIKPKDLEFLKQYGIPEESIKPIMTLVNRYAARQDNVALLNWRYWPEGKEKDIMGQFVDNFVHGIILNPSPPDIPYFLLSTQYGRMLGQFKSFTSTASSRIFIGAQQQEQSNKLMAVMSIGMGGYMSYALGKIMTGQEVDTSMDNVALQAVSRSGMMPLLYDQLWNASSLSRGGRYQGVDPLSVLAGPYSSLVKNAYTAGAGLTDKEGNMDIDGKDLNKFYRLLPFSNLFYIKGPLMKLTNNLGEGDQEQSRSKKARTKRNKRGG